MNSETKYCINCKHFYIDPVIAHHPDLGRCTLTTKTDTCLVSGKTTVSHKFAEHHRYPNEGNCGPDAKFFEQK